MHNDWDREDINGNALIVSSVFWEARKAGGNGKLVKFDLVDDDDDEDYLSCDEDEIIVLGPTAALLEATANIVDEMELDDFDNDDNEEKEEMLLLKLELKAFS